ncbi:MAG: hypothetical protein K8S15_01275 [Candidatus Aegiribacteria sp.]|nr:hypothetical protein [Candidatus Aegiribacteria sp.]
MHSKAERSAGIIVTQEFYPDLETILNRGSGPEAFTMAILGELDPIMEFLCSHLPISHEESVKWILMELTANAITAPISYLLGTKTGLTRDEMLSAIGTSAVWPDSGKENSSSASEEFIIRMEKVLGVSISQWLSMNLTARIGQLVKTSGSSWVSITVYISTAYERFEIVVQSEYPPLRGDIEGIRCCFNSSDETSIRIRKERKPFEDKDGIYHMPSFTGGGGMGLLACIRLAEEKELYLDYIVHDDPETGIHFRLGNHPVK